MPNIMDFFPSDYLKGVHLDGKTHTVEIDRMEERVIKNPRTQKDERKAVLFFKRAQRGLILTQTTATQIALLHGGDYSQWQGKRIAIFPEMVEVGNKTHCVPRIKSMVPPAPQPSPLAVDVDDHEMPDEVDEYVDLSEEEEIPLGLDDE